MMEKSSPERQFKGIRIRKWGRWVSEIRMPKSREKIWLGSYKTAEHAARAYDAALYCLKGPAAKFNFPDSVPAIPSASSLSRQQIQVAAAKYALDEIYSTSFSLQDVKNNSRQQIQVAAAKYALDEIHSTSFSLQDMKNNNN